MTWLCSLVAGQSTTKMWVKGWDRVEQPKFNTKNIIDRQTTLHSRPILVPHSDTEQHKNSFVLSTPPPIGTTPVTTRWRPPHLRTSDDGSPPKAPFNSHVCTPLPSYWYLKLGAAMYHIKIKIKRDKQGVNFVVVNHLSSPAGLSRGFLRCRVSEHLQLRLRIHLQPRNRQVHLSAGSDGKPVRPQLPVRHVGQRLLAGVRVWQRRWLRPRQWDVHLPSWLPWSQVWRKWVQQLLLFRTWLENWQEA